MKLFLIPVLFCITIVAKSQQLPKSESKDIFIEKYNFDKVEPLELQSNIRSSVLFGNKGKQRSSFLNSTNVFKDTDLLVSSNKYPNYNIIILDTKNDDSKSIVLKPDSSFKSNMPIVRYK